MAIIQLRKCSQGIWKVCIHCIWFILQEPINDNCFEYLRCQTSKKRHRQTLIFEKKHGKPTAGYQGGHHREQVCNQRKICQQMVFFFLNEVLDQSPRTIDVTRMPDKFPVLHEHSFKSLLSFEN